jgi:hypothetical protein
VSCSCRCERLGRLLSQVWKEFLRRRLIDNLLDLEGRHVSAGSTRARVKEKGKGGGDAKAPLIDHGVVEAGNAGNFNQNQNWTDDFYPRRSRY